MRLKNKVAIVTGGGSGNGQGIAWGLSKEGAKVAVADLNLDGAQYTVSEMESEGLALKADVAERAEVENLLKDVLSRFGKVDILINNAGMALMQPFMEVDDELWGKTLRVNLTTTFVCSQVTAKQMIQDGGGNIICVSSIGGIRPLPPMSHYCAAKAGVILLAKTMALELAPHKIRVNAIAPGIIETPATRIRTQDPERREKYLANVPLKKIGAPADLVGTIIYLASADSEYVTGEVIRIDGGWAA